MSEDPKPIRYRYPEHEVGMFEDQSHLGREPANYRRLDPEREIEGHPGYPAHELAAGNADARDEQFRDRYAIKPKILEQSPHNARFNAGADRPVAQCERCQWQVQERDFRPGEITNRCRQCGGLMQLADGIYSWVDPEEGEAD